MVLGQKLKELADYHLKADGLTINQVLVLIAIERGFDFAPSISEITALLSTSRQNVKQLTSQLEKKGFVKMIKDTTDRRVLRVKTTSKNEKYWKQRDSEHLVFIDKIFDIFTTKEKEIFNDLADRLFSHVQELITN